MTAPIPIRWLRECGMRAVLRVFWGDDCADCIGSGSKGYHNAEIHLVDSNRIGDFDLGGSPSDHPEQCWPRACDHCSAPVPPTTKIPCMCGDPNCSAVRTTPSRQVHHRRMYSTPSGEVIDRPAIGDAWLADWWHHDDGSCGIWSNCDGKHVIVKLPGGVEFDAMSRASNCTMKDDRSHRCWRVHGNLETGAGLTFDKNGLTCNAGAGSIQLGNWHGYVKQGFITT